MATIAVTSQAMAEDRISDVAVKGTRRGSPGVSQDRLGAAIRRLLGSYRTIEGWWLAARSGYKPEFVEWVDEQRSESA